MAKRFTDTDKYKKKFIRGLKGAYKLLWDYLYHDCDHAGIWIVDFEIAQIYLGKDMLVSKEDALSFFNDTEERIIEISNTKWFIPSFVDFQYGKLNPKNKAHNSVINILEKYDLIENCKIKHKGLDSSLKVAKDKDKELDMDKDLDKDSENSESEDELKYLRDKSVTPQVFFQNRPHPKLDEPAIKIVEKIIFAKNKDSQLKPDIPEIAEIKAYLLLGGSIESLERTIEGAVISDKKSKQEFDLPKLTAYYITAPKIQTRLIGCWDIEQSKTNRPPIPNKITCTVHG